MPIREGRYRVLPGQYWDSETGTSYNYHRTYDPALGRYIQSDPIGLKGGINTFSYVGNKPLLHTDRMGLLRDGDGGDEPTERCILFHEVPIDGMEFGFFYGIPVFYQKSMCIWKCESLTECRLFDEIRIKVMKGIIRPICRREFLR